MHSRRLALSLALVLLGAALLAACGCAAGGQGETVRRQEHAHFWPGDDAVTEAAARAGAYGIAYRHADGWRDAGAPRCRVAAGEALGFRRTTAGVEALAGPRVVALGAVPADVAGLCWYYEWYEPAPRATVGLGALFRRYDEDRDDAHHSARLAASDSGRQRDRENRVDTSSSAPKRRSDSSDRGSRYGENRSSGPDRRRTRD